MPSPPENINADITPTEFELLIKEYLEEAGKDLKSFQVIHDVKINRIDGEYQIDVYAELEVLGAVIKILVECKRHQDRIKREVVQLLFDKIRATGSHKGMIFSTSGFQEGAVLYAKEHGIALVRVIDSKYTFETKSLSSKNFAPPSWLNRPKYVGEYKIGNTTSYLQKGYIEDLKDFLFAV